MSELLHDHAVILAIGDELTLGQKLDTNSQWLSAHLRNRGITTRRHETVPDTLEQLTCAMRRAAHEAPLVICTGGLGPTPDDLTRHALADVLEEQLETDVNALANLEARFAARNRQVSANQRLQALRPSSAHMLDNPMGTAPGLCANITTDGHTSTVFCLPGPPREMQPMFVNHVAPVLRTNRQVQTAVLHSAGLPEADVAQRLGNLMNRDRNPTVGTTASGGIVSLRIRFESNSDDTSALNETVLQVRAALDPFIFGAGDDTLASVVLHKLREQRERLVTVESCTGGLLGAALTEVPGASDVYWGGWVTYANELKMQQVGVPKDLLDAHGAVSAEAAQAMARGALAAPGCKSVHHVLAITGIAGPSGGSDEKPVGTVFVARAARSGESEVRRFLITGDRQDIRTRSVTMALAMLRMHLDQLDVRPLLWEQSGTGL